MMDKLCQGEETSSPDTQTQQILVQSLQFLPNNSSLSTPFAAAAFSSSVVWQASKMARIAPSCVFNEQWGVTFSQVVCLISC